MKRTWKQNWRSVISMVVGLALLLGGLPVFRAEATGETQPVFNWDLDAGQVKANKTVTGTDDKDIFEVKLEAAGRAFSSASAKKADIVLVIDASGSMKDSMPGSSTKKLAAARDAAVSAAELLMRSGSDNRIAVVFFGSEIKGSDTDRAFAKDIATVRSRINSNSIVANGGTNIQVGLHAAQALLAKRDAQRKETAEAAVILLSDGAPTYYNPTLYPGGTLRGSGNSTNALHIYHTVRQAAQLKQATGAEIYTIGLDVENNAQAQAVLQPTQARFNGITKYYEGQMRTLSRGRWGSWVYYSDSRQQRNNDDNQYRWLDGTNADGLEELPKWNATFGYWQPESTFNATTTNIKDIFKAIASSISDISPVKDSVTVTDVIGAGFEVEGVLPAGAQINGNTITWEIFNEDLPTQGSATDAPVVTPATLTFRVKRTATAPGTYYTNAYTTQTEGANKATFVPAEGNAFYDDVAQPVQLFLSDFDTSIVTPQALDDELAYLASDIRKNYDVTEDLKRNDLSALIPGASIVAIGSNVVMQGNVKVADVSYADGEVTVTPRAGGTGTFTYTLSVPLADERVPNRVADLIRTVTVSVEPEPSILLIKTVVGESTLKVGDTASYKLEIRNPGPHDLTDVYFTDSQLPANAADVRGATYINGKWVVGNGRLAVDEAATITYPITYDSKGSKQNDAVAFGTGSGVTVHSKAKETVTVLSHAQLSLDKTVAQWDGQAPIGEFKSGLRITPGEVQLPTPLAVLLGDDPPTVLDPALELERLQDAVNAAQLALDTANAALATAKAELEALKNGDTSILQAAVDAAQGEVNTAATALENAEGAKTDKVAARQAAEAALAGAQTALGSAQSALASAKDDFDAATTAVENAQDDLDNANSEDDNYEALQQALTAAQAAVGVAQGLYDEASGAKDAAEQARDSANTALTDATSEAGDAIAAYELALKAFDEANAKLTAAQAALSGAGGGSANESAIADKAAEILAKQQTVDEKAEDLTAAKSVLEAFIADNRNIGDVTGDTSVVFKITITNTGESNGIANLEDDFEGLIWYDSSFQTLGGIPSNIPVQGTGIEGAPGSVTYYAVALDLEVGTHVNTAIVGDLRESATVVVNPAPQAVFEVEKTVTANGVTGKAATIFDDEGVTFTIRVTNSGDAPGSFSLLDLLNGQQVDLTQNTQTVTAQNVTLGAGSSTEFTYTTNASSLLIGDNTNVAVLTQQEAEEISSTATVRVIERTPEIGLAKHVWDAANDEFAPSTTIDPDQTARFQVVIINTGTGDATVALADLLTTDSGGAIPSLGDADITTFGGAQSREGEFYLPRYTGKVVVTYVTEAFVDSGEYINTATVTGEGINDVPDAIAVVSVTERTPQFAITKTVDPSNISTGGSATFKIEIINNGNGVGEGSLYDELGLQNAQDVLKTFTQWSEFTVIEGEDHLNESGLGFNLPAGGKIQVTVTYTFSEPGVYVNTAGIVETELIATAIVTVTTPSTPPPTSTPTPTTPPTTPTEPTPPPIIPYTPSPSPTPGPTLPPEEVIEDEDVPLGLPTESPAPAQIDETIEEAAIPFAHPKTGERTSGVSVWMLAGAVVMFAVSAVLWHLDSKRAGKRK